MKTAAPRSYHLDVDISPERAGQVRRILAAHLRHWGLETLADPVGAGAELLLRAIDRHTVDKRATVEMWWNGHHLITAVAEHDPDLRPDQDLRACLARLAATSDGWGCCATAQGAKVIWFTQRARTGRRAPLVPVAPLPALRTGLDLPRALPAAG
ncbi:pep a2 [Streptomyces roseirectus]|uniref:Pep a2 n=1 Tax=Streptomyces roseirectus TaxID=2768066 RepID=A0A7H0I6N2_9ACTN|nr:pep a2 [Streptomyces roseirectus]QNP68448.1 pep a2 [Streptomyces roseirectus]